MTKEQETSILRRTAVASVLLVLITVVGFLVDKPNNKSDMLDVGTCIINNKYGADRESWTMKVLEADNSRELYFLVYIDLFPAKLYVADKKFIKSEYRIVDCPIH